MFRGGTAGDVVGVRQGPPLHLCQHTLLVEQGLEEPRVAVELHQVEDLKKGGKGRKVVISGVTDNAGGMNKQKARGRKKEIKRKGKKNTFGKIEDERRKEENNLFGRI